MQNGLPIGGVRVSFGISSLREVRQDELLLDIFCIHNLVLE